MDDPTRAYASSQQLTRTIGRVVGLLLGGAGTDDCIFFRREERAIRSVAPAEDHTLDRKFC